jgi:hypothetical protein
MKYPPFLERKTNLQGIHRSLVLSVFLAVLLIAAAFNAQAQNSPKFKVGDRVEVTMSHGVGPWEKGSIVQVNVNYGNYVVQIDPFPGMTPRNITVPMYYDTQGFIRLGGGALPQILTDNLRVDRNNTVLANRDLLDCQNLVRGGKNGSPLPIELAKKLIRCHYEAPSPVGQDGATTMDITDFTTGASRAWVVGIDRGQGELNTRVYPVHVRWNQKTFYRTRNVAITDKEATFTCFADNTNLWICGIAAGPNNDGKTQEFLIKQ